MKGKRFIETSFPVKEVSEYSSKEKNIRHGHISTLHIWWARRPLASSRATNYAALIPEAKTPEEWEKTRQFIVELSKWESSLNPHIIKKARNDILKAYNGVPPRILDPFSGGGSIPLEALRLGCEVHAIDYNPVANLILKCTLEYPQKYGRSKKRKAKKVIMGKEHIVEVEYNPLLEDVKKWGDWVLKEAKKEIGRFYPQDEDGFIPVGYIWARTIPCQNPTCNAEIPLMRQFWLAKKKNKRVALYPYVKGNEVKFKIVEDGYEDMPEDFDPSKGSVSMAIATCPVCGFSVEANTIKKLFREGKSGEKLIAVVLHKNGISGKKYRIAAEKDMQIFKEAEIYLNEKREILKKEWGIAPVPDEIIYTPTGNEYTPQSLSYNFTPIVLYNMTRWDKLFNPRQKLALITFTEKVRNAYKAMIDKGYDKEYAKAVVSYLGLGVNRLADKNSVLCRLISQTEAIGFTYGRQALPMLWDYIEMNIFEHTSAWKTIMHEILGNLFHFSQIPETSVPKITQSSAASLPYSDNFFDAVFTDPPYYDNVPYSYLSDFFYVWLKRSVGNLYSELFITPLTPKSKEVIAELPLLRGMPKNKASDFLPNIKTKEKFEEMLKNSFKEIARVLKPNGIATIIYAHKTTSGWETLINSLLEANLIPTASWPLDTEMKARLRAKKSAALSSSIYFVCRKIERKDTGWLNEVKDEIKNHIHKKLKILWEEGISGADYFISAIGSAIEIFGKYKKVMDYEGNEITAANLLDYVREIVTDYAIKEILHESVSLQLSPLTRFYVLWRWSFGLAKAPFDDAKKIAQSVGINLEEQWNKGFIKKEKGVIKILGPNERKFDDIKYSTELIDVLHTVLILWKKNKKQEILNIFKRTGFGKSDTFYKVAQAISETLPLDSEEKKLLDGFLSGKEQIKTDLSKRQSRLFGE